MLVVGKRLLFLVLGFVATGIAIIGVWLPGVPTVFPLIMALWAFSRSSERLRRRVEKLPLLGQALAEAKRFERERTIDLRVKLIAAASAWASTLLVMTLVHNIVVTMLVAGAALTCTIVMLSVPTRKGGSPLRSEQGSCD